MKHQFNLFYSLEKLLSNTALFFLKKKHAYPGGKGVWMLPLFASFLRDGIPVSPECQSFWTFSNGNWRGENPRHTH